MSDGLRDPDLPPGAVVEIQKDGSALRNDGRVLQPASKNPWYVLMTVYGEQTGGEIDWRLAEMNRRIWNGWACVGKTDDERAEMAKAMELSVPELAPLTESETKALRDAFILRLPDGARPPSPAAIHDLSGLHFENSLVLNKFVFVQPLVFKGANFHQIITLESARLIKSGNFEETSFNNSASFSLATFTKTAYFRSSNFKKSANFISTIFTMQADFEFVCFASNANFGNATFIWRCSWTPARTYPD